MVALFVHQLGFFTVKIKLTGSRIVTVSSINSVMAAGRGEFFQTFLEGVESILALGRRPPGRRRGRPGRRRNKRHPPKSAPCSESEGDLR